MTHSDTPWWTSAPLAPVRILKRPTVKWDCYSATGWKTQLTKRRTR
jgi:hypothetical protein